MNRTMRLVFAIVVVGVMTASAQSLGDAARTEKSKKPKTGSSRVWTNDDMPSVGVYDAEPAATEVSDQNASKSEKKDAAAENRKKLETEWRKKIDDQKKKVADLERELDLLDREHKLRAAAFYADAGLRLRDDRNWADQERKYQEDIESRKKAIADAKQELEETQERARKAGVPHATD